MSKKLSNEQFLVRINNIHGNTIIPLEDYINSNKGIKFKCTICNTIWSTAPYHIIGKNPTGCPKCAKKRIAQSQTLSKKEILKSINERKDFELVDWLNYKTVKDKVLIRHKKCGCEFKITMINFKNGKGCPNCRFDNLNILKKKDSSYYINKMKKYSDFKEYEILSEINGCDNKVKMRHLKCGHIIYISPNKFNSGRRCKYCFNNNSSHGNSKIERILTKNKIKFETEKTFDDCRNSISNYRLRFDFYLPDYNILIEYDGRQHFDWTYQRGKDNKEKQIKFEESKIRDSIKNLYCLKNDIKLIRINYLDFDNIKNILQKNIKESSSTRESD